MSDTVRHEEGIAVASWAAGLLAGSVANWKHDDLLKMDVQEVVRTPDGFTLDCRTEQGFGISIDVRLTDWSG